MYAIVEYSNGSYARNPEVVKTGGLHKLLRDLQTWYESEKKAHPLWYDAHSFFSYRDAEAKLYWTDHTAGYPITTRRRIVEIGKEYDDGEKITNHMKTRWFG